MVSSMLLFPKKKFWEEGLRVTRRDGQFIRTTMAYLV